MQFRTTSKPNTSFWTAPKSWH